jgi:hypothetical protein
MKNLLLYIFTITILSPLNVFSQNETEEQINWPEEPLPMYQVIEIFPKAEFISEFVNEVNSHRNQFYKGEDSNKAYLRKVIAGGQIHKFYWIKGPFSSKEYDEKEFEFAKTNHWNKNVIKYIKDYGDSNFYRHATPLSTQSSSRKVPKYAKIWRMSFKEGENAMAKTFQLANRIKKARESVGLSYHIFWPTELKTKGWKMDIVETAERLEDLYDSKVDLKAAFEKIYGEDSFSKHWEEWDQLVVLESTELRVLIE